MTAAPAVRWITCAYCDQRFVSARAACPLCGAPRLDLRYAFRPAPAAEAGGPRRPFQADPAQIARYWHDLANWGLGDWLYDIFYLILYGAQRRWAAWRQKGVL